MLIWIALAVGCVLLGAGMFFFAQLSSGLKGLEALLERMEKGSRDDLTRNREEWVAQSRHLREEIGGQLRSSANTTETRMDSLRESVQQRLSELQQDNAAKLELMRQTVDEKLQTTLERRLSESFHVVSQRLEAVQKGLGEMQSLATGVGDLKRLLTNVKTRGSWGEMQLKSLLSEILTKDQYQENVKTREDSQDFVEVAIRLPGRRGDEQEPVWLPVDSKFPVEDYQRILDARDQGDAASLEKSTRDLVDSVKREARRIREKYLNPPKTTDFGIMYLPSEGLYAEVVQIRGLAEVLQREHRISVVGPSNLAALLNSLQMGFRTLAIEKKSGEVWALLGAIKTEFGRFGDLLDRTQRKLEEASQQVESAARKSRTIARKLNRVHEVPAEQAREMLSEDGAENDPLDGNGIDGPLL
ncbi:MAG: DNA recombination protein RmuC [Elusimicrobia bacterium]|nr:DNA recombination protein RmuC [Elusimicrobiota bacterium]